MFSWRGAAQITLAGLMFAAMGAGVKAVSGELPNGGVVFLRNAFALAFFLPWLAREEGLKRLRTAALSLHLLRSLAGLTAIYCFFFTISHLRLADAVLLNYTVPLFMPLIARVWLKEEWNRTMALPLLLGFVGVALIVKPTAGLFNPVALIGLSAGLSGAVAQVTVRRLTRTEPVFRIVFYFAFISTLLSALPAGTTPYLARPGIWVIMAGVGLTAAAGQVFLTRGYSLAPVAAVGPFIYSSVLFAGLFDWLLWSNLSDVYSLAGAALVCLGGIATMRIRSGRGTTESL
jgi:drug/metabolite transporter (DMT)-like permease